MAKAMGLNTISTYVFWNFHEPLEGQFDFSSPSHNLSHFLNLAQAEGLLVLLRPGPFECAEWDFGGLPLWLLKYEDLRVRTFDKRYLNYVEIYFRKLAEIITPLQITNGGPVVMVQLENEYGSYGTDHTYIAYLQKLWVELGVTVPFYSADVARNYSIASGHVPGAAIGLDAGISVDAYTAASQVDSTVVSFSSETYPGWLTHWGERWAGKTIQEICNEVQFIFDSGKSFSLYMVHGGTNFGFWAGANYGVRGYTAHITSYDYDAPISENGVPTEKFFALKNIIAKYVKNPIPLPPDPIPTISIDKVQLDVFSSIWENFAMKLMFMSDYPQFFEFFDQQSGLIIYRTNLTNGKTSGKLSVSGLADYALVFLDDVFLGTLDRTHSVFEIDIPQTGKNQSKLEIVVEGMGRINSGHQMTDRKGIKGNVTLDGVVLKGWEMIRLPLDDEFMGKVEQGHNFKKQGVFFKGKFVLGEVGDTFIDVSQWEKGIVFVNGKNLGRYWKIGPQFRLYCPASVLRIGQNEVLILDLQLMSGSYVTGEKSLK